MSGVSQGVESVRLVMPEGTTPNNNELLAQSPAKRDESPYPLRWRAWYAVQLLTRIRQKSPVLWQEIVDFAVKENV